jgi:hypothetical protein
VIIGKIKDWSERAIFWVNQIRQPSTVTIGFCHGLFGNVMQATHFDKEIYDLPRLPKSDRPLCQNLSRFHNPQIMKMYAGETI